MATIPTLQIPQMGAVSGGADFAPLAQLGTIYQKAQQDAANKQAFATYQQTGDPRALIGSGDMNLAQLGISAQNHLDTLRQQGIENKRADINVGLAQAAGARAADEFKNTEYPEDTTPTQRAALAVKNGIDPKSPEGKQYILAGTLPPANQGIPAGYQRTPEGILAPTKGGPEDPETIKAQAEAKRLPGMGDDALKPMVESYSGGNTGVLVGIGRGAQGPQNLQRFWELLSQKLTAEGKTGNDLASARANFMAQSAAAKTAAVRESSVETSVNEARGTFPLVIQRSLELPRGSWVPYNKLLDMVRTNQSSPEQNRYNAAIQSAITAYSQAMSRTGASTVHSQQHAEDIINKYSGHEGIKAALEQLDQEMAIARSAPEETRKSILEKIIGIKADPATGGAATSSSAGAGAAASGKPAVPFSDYFK